MAEKDFRVWVDLCFPPEQKGIAQGLINHLRTQIDKAVNINLGDPANEVGYIILERCGHRLGESCEVVEKYEVV